MAHPKLRPTIRTRLTLAAVAATVVMLTVASLTLVTLQRRSLTQGIDESLRQTADNLQPLGVVGGGFPAIGDPEDMFVQLLGGDGDVVASTPNAGDAPAIAVRPGNVDRTTIQTVRVEVPTGWFRVLVQPALTDDGRSVLVIGKNLDDVTETAHVLIAALAVVSPLLVLMLGALAWWLIGRTLRPVDDMRREVQSIGGGELHRRVPVPNTDDEIATLARTMNDMLARAEHASDQQQQFVDDASHELRTPLTRMITELDVAIAHPADDMASIMRGLHDDATDLRMLLEDLLYLARSSHTAASPSTEVDLDDIVLSTVAHHRHHPGRTIDVSGVSAAPVRGDGRALGRAIDNLISNAVRHAHGTVTVSSRSVSGDSIVVIDDDGDGIALADRERVFTRFTRLDEARSRDRGGAGLGLAIAEEIVARHRGAITISDNPSGGARFVVTIPCSDENADVTAVE
ncbi:MAG: HAMP domain-containing sensor histidine kinase [Ilumatobacteraceae bacterium]